MYVQYTNQQQCHKKSCLPHITLLATTSNIGVYNTAPGPMWILVLRSLGEHFDSVNISHMAQY